MVEAVHASNREPVSLIDRSMIGGFGAVAFPVLMAILTLVALSLTINRAGALAGWAEGYDGTGEFLVESCQQQPAFGGGQWSCSGRLTSEGADQELRTTMITSMGARVSERPYVGQRLEAFHASGDRSEVYPLAYRLNEMTRLYLSLIPRLLLMVGAVMWLAGWFLTRNTDPDDLVARDGMRLPQRFGWKTRALNWFIAAGAVWVINYLVTTRIIGSLDII